MKTPDFKNILLINTPSMSLSPADEEKRPLARQSQVSVYLPLGVCYISSFLREKGYGTDILDLEVEIFCLIKREGGYNLDKVKRLIKEKMDSIKPEVVGISCSISSRYNQAHKICEIVKSVKEDVVIVMGGNYPTNSAESALQDKNVDYVVIGEGELVFWNLLESLKNEKDIGSLKGIGYKNSDRIEIKGRGSADFITDLDSLPFPDYDRLPIQKYYDVQMSQSMDKEQGFFLMFTSRGCPRQCIYCGARNIFGNRYRTRSVENVLAEIDWLTEKYNVEQIEFQDDNLTLNRKRAEAIFDGLIRRERKLHWSIPNGLDVSTLDRDLLEKMKKSGGRDFVIAVESANERVLKMICKTNVDLKRTKETVDIIKDLGIYIKVFFMVGFPGETKEEMQDTIDYAAELKADWSIFNIANPLPGSVLAEIVAEKGYLRNGTVELSKIRYVSGNIETEEFSPEYVEELAYDANIRINFLNNPNLENNRIDFAIRDFRRIADRYADHSVARYCLAKALFKKGLYEEGEAEMEKLRRWQENNKGKSDLLKKYNIIGKI